ncbi:4-hydroxy-3-methylbut-2-enyl diphosphate reductase [Escherichia coli]|nr:4-hydroxy-3-methylbut-2-enyl diphosphate reductase [Escherichia coli]EFW55755.1 YgbK domain protein [Shigella boydii ATCC 9905]EFZ4916387.1 4-hydroxy-3-methylbut-2-enyl diphosphate reductase [Shigella boydii]RIF74922.1 4-hydroxy-3-methylbut-2-enyl diphosphate reductase [Shigella boydii]
MIKIGVIADDFTGATDIASFLVENGLPTVQINGVPTGKMPEAIDALVISLKTRSCPVVCGESLQEAANNMEELEETAKLIFILGDRPIRYLTAGEIAELRS